MTHHSLLDIHRVHCCSSTAGFTIDIQFFTRLWNNTPITNWYQYSNYSNCAITAMSAKKYKRSMKSLADCNITPKKQRPTPSLSDKPSINNKTNKIKPPTVIEKKYAVAYKYVDQNQSITQHDQSIIHYAGYIPNSNMLMKDSSVPVDTVDYNDIDSELFYTQYVSQRKPCIIRNAITDTSEFHSLQQWSDLNYLRAHAGNELVTVEHRSTVQNEYGKGNKKQMKFKEFVDLIESNNELHYISTQPCGDKDTQQQHFNNIIQSPLKSLMNDFPLQPSFMSNLIPYQYNIWAGCSRNWSSSSLHHDYHDNLYILLAGLKRFTIFPPSDVYAMKTYGNVKHVHENGLINYESCITRGDGVPIDIIEDTSTTGHKSNKLHSVQDVEELINKYETELEQLQSSTAVNKQELIDDVQNKLFGAEELLDAALDGELGGAIKFADDNDTDDASDIDTSINNKQSPIQRTPSNSSTSTQSMPDNFSCMSVKALRMNSPLALGKLYAELVTAHRITITLKANELLYLPCGWFHEVSTMSGNDHKSIAMNYWFHPPDQLNQFNQPYQHGYWMDQWNKIKPKLDQIKSAKSNTTTNTS